MFSLLKTLNSSFSDQHFGVATMGSRGRGKGRGNYVPEEDEVTSSHKGRGRSLVKGKGKNLGKNYNVAGEPAHDGPAAKTPTTIAAPSEAKHKAKRARSSPSAGFGDTSAPSRVSWEENTDKPQKSARRTSQEYYEIDDTRVVPKIHKAASSVGKGDEHHNKGKAHGKGKGSYKGKGGAKGKGCEQGGGSKGMGGKTKTKPKAKAKAKAKAASKRKTGDDDYGPDDYKTPVKKRPATARVPMGITPPGKDYGSLSLSL